METANGKFSFTAGQVLFGTPLAVLNGRVRVERVPSTLALTTSSEDQDYPALAVSGDNAYLAYVEFAHSDRAQESFATLKAVAREFRLAGAPGGRRSGQADDLVEIVAPVERGGGRFAGA